MAKEENTPALIDYEGASAAAQSANQGNAFADCKRYWKNALFKSHKVAGIAWGVVEQTNLSRLLKQFESEQVHTMIDEWMKKELQYAVNFNLFYKNRYVLQERTGPKDYDW